jgi:RNA polymerase sigma-70 factor (ECF subfamily)
LSVSRADAAGAVSDARSCSAAEWSRDACAAFVAQHDAELFGWLAWLTRDRDSAADLTQEAFAEFWASVKRRPVRDARVWLFGIARNRWRKWLRRRRAHPPIAASGIETVVAPDAEDLTRRRELADLIAALLARLPTSVREAIVLRYWCDFDHRSIAAVQGVPASLVRWRVHRGRSLLRGWLHDKGLSAEDLIHDD